MAERTGRLLTVEDLAELVGVPPRTVYTWRQEKTGPRGIRVGKHLRFRLADVEAWLEKRADPTPAA